MKLPRDRVPYSAIVDRPQLKLPNDARIAVWTIVNVEEWSIERNMPRTVLPPPYGQPLMPDLPNWSWHEYGMRVGFWRFLEVLNRFHLKATLAINGSVCKSYPRVAEAGLKAGWEFMGHGYIQRPMHHVEDQRAAIRDTVEAIRQFTGKAPRGWESPGLTETYDTIDWLAEAGIEYVADWCCKTIRRRNGCAAASTSSIASTGRARSRLA
jgi:allantoinase